MRTLLILTSLLLMGCAHDSSLQVIGSIYCEAERPEGKAVAKVELRYTPPVDEQHNQSQLAPNARGETPKQTNQESPKNPDPKSGGAAPATQQRQNRDSQPITQDIRHPFKQLPLQAS
jgi:hypothetical protein